MSHGPRSVCFVLLSLWCHVHLYQLCLPFCAFKSLVFLCSLSGCLFVYPCVPGPQFFSTVPLLCSQFSFSQFGLAICFGFSYYVPSSFALINGLPFVIRFLSPRVAWFFLNKHKVCCRSPFLPIFSPHHKGYQVNTYLNLTSQLYQKYGIILMS